MDDTSHKILKGGRRNTRANGHVSGGGGGWREMNEAMAERRAEVSGQDAETNGTSIFDPVICEMVYRWFCPRGGRVLDPFAGGSVRGIVASLLGRHYVGVDLRAEQIAANQSQSSIAAAAFPPDWRCGDSANIKAVAPGEYDLVFSCPPYGDLERYSDDPSDLSTLAPDEFFAAYSEIIAASVSMLKPDRFACFVVGDYRRKDGFYANLPMRTTQAFEAAGARLYNDAVLVTAIGSLPIRTAKQFESSRKLGKTHQNVLIFCNGDPKKATEAIGAVEFSDGMFEDEAER